MLWSLGAGDPSCVLRHRADIKAGSRARHPDANGCPTKLERTFATESFGSFLV